MIILWSYHLNPKPIIIPKREIFPFFFFFCPFKKYKNKNIETFRHIRHVWLRFLNIPYQDMTQEKEEKKNLKHFFSPYKCVVLEFLYLYRNFGNRLLQKKLSFLDHYFLSLPGKCPVFNLYPFPNT